MVLFATVVFGGGLCLLALAGIFLLLSFGDQRAVRTLRRVVPSPAATWRRGRVAGEVFTEYGVAGRQVAPLTGADCVWYEVTLVRRPTRGDNLGGDSLIDVTTPAWPAVADHSGRIPLDPAMFAPPSEAVVTTTIHYSVFGPVAMPPIVPAAILDDLHKGETLELTERRVDRGLEVYALGRMTAAGLTRNRRGLTVLTTDSRPRLLAARRGDVSFARKAVLYCTVVGTVLSGTSAAGLYALT